MNRKKLIKTYIMTWNWKEPFGLHGFYNNISTLWRLIHNSMVHGIIILYPIMYTALVAQGLNRIYTALVAEGLNRIYTALVAEGLNRIYTASSTKVKLFYGVLAAQGLNRIYIYGPSSTRVKPHIYGPSRTSFKPYIYGPSSRRVKPYIKP